MAAPMVSGAVALLLEKEPGLTPDQVKAQLMRTANKSFPSATTTYDATTGETFYSQYDIFTVGAGYLDVHAALMSSELPPAGKGARSPLVRYNTDSDTVRVLTTSGALWSSGGRSGLRQRAAELPEFSSWSVSGVWGTSVLLDGTSAIWGTTAPWGTATYWNSDISGDLSAIWGTTDSPSGKSAMWGTGDASQGHE